MKKSFYNFIFPGEEGKSILYNSRTGAMAELDSKHAEQLERLSERELEEQNPNFVNALLENGFAVEDGVSELDMIRYDMWKTRFGNQAMSITVEVTQNCNFGCKYCYEKGIINNKYMDIEVQDAIVEYIRAVLPGSTELNVCWYGGEPLLAIPVIQRLTSKFLALCEEKNITYKAKIITNGYLLTQQVAEILAECKVRTIQITLDGNEDMHNARRTLLDGGPTYFAIWNNLLQLKAQQDKFRVMLRVNIDKENKSAVYEVQQRIREAQLDEFVCVYPGKVVATSECHNSENCCTEREFAVLEQEFICSDPELLNNYYPKRRNVSCMADSNKAMIFDTDGYIYKCFMDICTPERRIGNVKNGAIYNENVLFKYLLLDVPQQKECNRCKWLPICMGGCLNARFRGEKTCTRLKYVMDEYMGRLLKTVRQGE